MNYFHFHILRIHFYPGTENVADESNVQTVGVGRIVIHTHIMEHVKDVDPVGVFFQKLFGLGQKGVVLFVSSLGYTSKGSGLSIPPYSPLLFEIELL